MPDEQRTLDAAITAQQIAAKLDAQQLPYAFGEAIALGYWATPRGTVDVDPTLFLPHDQPTACLKMLRDLECEFSDVEISPSLLEHGFCRVRRHGIRVDAFLPLIDFYECARQRRRQVDLEGQPIFVWDAETLCVFKMMFFRRKDLTDVEQFVRTQGSQLGRVWIRQRLTELYGVRAPRLSQWNERVEETSAP